MACENPAIDAVTNHTGRSSRLPRLLAAPDAMKGTARASDLASAIAAAAESAGWSADACPLSDGGEGFAEVLRQGDAVELTTTVTGPLGASVEARWLLDGETAIVESAEASSLALAGGAGGNDPVLATSRGTGELIVAAIEAGATRLLVGVGGSACTDGGLGARQAIQEALGSAPFRSVQVDVACDVRTLFVDAAERFGPQKGAVPDQVALLRGRLEALAVRFRDENGVDVSTIPGGGAAGGLAGGLAALGARLVPGFDVLSEVVGLEQRIEASDLVVTGEGCFDATSWEGKVVGGVIRHALRRRTPVLVVAGSVTYRAPAHAPPAGFEAIDLSERCGLARSLSDPLVCVAEAVKEALLGNVHHQRWYTSR
jgi:glycerate kinase